MGGCSSVINPPGGRREHRTDYKETEILVYGGISYHTLTKAMNLGEKRLSSELLSCGGSPLTTWVS